MSRFILHVVSAWMAASAAAPAGSHPELLENETLCSALRESWNDHQLHLVQLQFSRLRDTESSISAVVEPQVENLNLPTPDMRLTHLYPIFVVAELVALACAFEWHGRWRRALGDPSPPSPKRLPWYSWCIVLSLDLMLQFSIDSFVPNMPTVAKELGTTEVLVSFSLFGMWISKGFGGVLMGAVSERWGRRPVFIHGCAVITLCSLGCCWTGNIGMLIFFRTLQGLEGTSDLSLTVVQDVLEDQRARVMMNRVRWLMRTLTVVLAPSVGGYIGAWYGWRSVFFFQGCWSFANLLFVLAFLEETKHPDEVDETTNVGGGDIRDLMDKSVKLLSSGVLMSTVLLFSFMFSALHCMLATLAFALEDKLGFSVVNTAALMSLVPIFGLAMPIVLMMCLMMITRVAPMRELSLGMMVQLSAVFIAVFQSFFALESHGRATFLVMTVVVLCVTGFGIAIAPLETLFMERAKHMAGMASGFQQMVSQIIASTVAVIGVWATQQFGIRGMLYVMASTMLVGQVVFWFLFRPAVSTSESGKGRGDSTKANLGPDDVKLAADAS